jgi:hypothetical protein
MGDKQDLEQIMQILAEEIFKWDSKDKTDKQRLYFRQIKKRLSCYESDYRRAYGLFYIPIISIPKDL